MDISEKRTDADKEVGGVWIDFDGETRLLIARYLNPEHKQYVQKAMAPYKRQMRNDAVGDDVYKRIDAKGMARHVLLNWEGMKEAERLLSDPGLEFFSDFVRETAQDLSLYRQQEVEESADNLKK